jgi:hypothetical protein
MTQCAHTFVKRCWPQFWVNGSCFLLSRFAFFISAMLSTGLLLLIYHLYSLFSVTKLCVPFFHCQFITYFQYNSADWWWISATDIFLVVKKQITTLISSLGHCANQINTNTNTITRWHIEIVCITNGQYLAQNRKQCYQPWLKDFPYSYSITVHSMAYKLHAT